MAVVRETDFGKSSLIRGSAIVFLLAANLLLPGRRQYRIIALLGGIICASFSWMGHGAATQGPAGWIHLGGDILHSLAAAAWIGALMVLAPWLMQSDAAPRMLVAALKNFSGFGIVFVATLIVTGLINSWFLVGVSHLPELWRSLYGELLVAKILLFLAMLWLAMRNRNRHVPRLAEQPSSSAGLRQSILVETGLGVIILALVAFIGMLPPPSSFHV
jgi:putative copper resistance protein D